MQLRHGITFEALSVFSIFDRTLLFAVDCKFLIVESDIFSPSLYVYSFSNCAASTTRVLGLSGGIVLLIDPVEWRERNRRTRRDDVIQQWKICFPSVARHPTEDGNEDAGSCDLGFNSLPPLLIPFSVSVVHRQTTSRNLLKQTFPEIHIRRRSSSSRHPRTSAAPPSVILEPNIRVFHPPTGRNLAILATCPAYTPQGQLLLDFPS